MDCLALRVYRLTSSMPNGQTENLDVLSYQAKTVMTITDPEVIKLFSCSTQLSMKFIMLINVN